jgi:imidazole glycerol phosphate synthase glutamine amidotransferase subunit
MTITIVDYGVGNLKSVQKAVEHLGESVLVTDNPDDIRRATKLIFPGQGACGHAMSYLKSKKLIDPIVQFIESQNPFLGICLGFQLLFDFSEEDGGQETLGIIPGVVKRFSEVQLKVPQMGWNTLMITRDSKSLSGVHSGEYVYFVHSFYVADVDSSFVTSTGCYGDTPFVASICKGSLWGMQFHPEKSGQVGLTILENFIAL